MRLLIVEDEQDLAAALATGLRREGYAVDVSHDGSDAFDKAIVNDYDLICLDLNLPGMDGREVCRRLRSELPPEKTQPRVLMLTARDWTEARIEGLDAGADDYLGKPFDFGELSARVRALLRRPAGRSGSLLTVGSIELDNARHEARREGRDLRLSPKEFALLRYLMTKAGEVISQEELLEHVWDEHADPFTKTVQVTVMKLRRRLEKAGGDQPIETIIGRGYRLKENA